MSSLTKILVVLQLVFSLVLAVLVVFGVSHIENYRSQVKAASDRENSAQVELTKVQTEMSSKSTEDTKLITDLGNDKTEFQKELLKQKEANTQLEIAKATAEAKAASLVDAITRLTATADSLQQLIKNKDAEIAKLQPENVKLVTQNAEINRALNEATTANRYAELAIRKLQEQIAAGPTKSSEANPAANGNDAQVKNLSATPANGPINGKITDARQAAGRTLIELSLGERDGVQVNSKFTIYRGSSYIGDAVIDSVTPDKSVATVTVVKPGQTVLRGDMVLSNNGQ